MAKSKTTKSVKNTNTQSVITSSQSKVHPWKVGSKVTIIDDIFNVSLYEQDGENSVYVYSGIPKYAYQELRGKFLTLKEDYVIENGSYWYNVKESIYHLPSVYLKIVE